LKTSENANIIILFSEKQTMTVIIVLSIQAGYKFAEKFS